MRDKVNFDLINGTIYVNWRYGYKLKNEDGYTYIPLKFSTGIRLEKERWDLKSKRVTKGTDKNKLNLKLNDIESKILKIVDDFEVKEGLKPSPDQIRKLYDTKQLISSKTSFVNFINAYLDDSPSIKQSTIKQYRYFANKLEAYETENSKIFIENLNNDSLSKILTWIERKSVKINENKKEEKNDKNEFKIITEGTLGKFKKNFKVFLRKASDAGHVVKVNFNDVRLKRKRVESDNIAFTREKLLALTILNLNEKGRVDLQQVLDLLIVSCYTGLRISDWNKLGSIIEGKDDMGKTMRYIEIRMRKTDDRTQIPINEALYKIYVRYGNKFPDKLCSQYYNRKIKELGKLMEWEEEITKREWRGSETIEIKHKYYEMMASHIGRRTFCTLSFQAQVPVPTIKKISGHKDDKSFFTYISNRDIIPLAEHNRIMNTFFGF